MCYTPPPPVFLAYDHHHHNRHHRYTLAAGVGVYAGMFLYRNSRLAGSPNLDTWVASGAASVESALSNHIVSPLVTVRDELFRTFRE